MRRVVTVAASLLTILHAAAASPARAAATTYHVRVDGSDQACNGKVDAPYVAAGGGGGGRGGMPAADRSCAFATPQKAADAMSTSAGDDIVIHAGTYKGKVALK